MFTIAFWKLTKISHFYHFYYSSPIKVAIEDWLKEPQAYCQVCRHCCFFLIQDMFVCFFPLKQRFFLPTEAYWSPHKWCSSLHPHAGHPWQVWLFDRRAGEEADRGVHQEEAQVRGDLQGAWGLQNNCSSISYEICAGLQQVCWKNPRDFLPGVLHLCQAWLWKIAEGNTISMKKEKAISILRLIKLISRVLATWAGSCRTLCSRTSSTLTAGKTKPYARLSRWVSIPNQMEENLAEQHNNEMVIIRAEQYKMSYSGHREQSVEPSTEHARHDRTWSVPSSSSVDILVASFYSVIQGEYMLNVKNKRMNSLKEEIECVPRGTSSTSSMCISSQRFCQPWPLFQLRRIFLYRRE